MAVVGKSKPIKYGSSPFHFWGAVIGAGISLAGSLIGRKGRIREQRDARAAMEKSKQAWMDIDYKNPYANMQNQFAGMENVYEDLEVNTQQADYMRAQQAQSQANIMNSLRGAAGGSGIAGLAQALANQGTQASQQAAASIGQQESTNQRAMMAEQSRIESLERQGATDVQLKKMQGQQYKEAQEQARLETLYGMDMSRVTAANEARNQARSDMMAGVSSSVAAGVGGWAKSGTMNQDMGDAWKWATGG